MAILFCTAGKELIDIPKNECDALSDAAFVFADHGIEFKLPWDCDMDDLERERFTALLKACRAYSASIYHGDVDGDGGLA